MMEVRDALRRLLAGQGLREVARQSGIDRKTVRRYKEAAQGAELTVDGLADDALIGAIIASVQERELPPPSEQRAQLVVQRARIEAWLGERPPPFGPPRAG